jgi:hypothetical protein
MVDHLDTDRVQAAATRGAFFVQLSADSTFMALIQLDFPALATLRAKHKAVAACAPSVTKS